MARRRVRWGSLDPSLLPYAAKLFAQAFSPVWTTAGAAAALLGLFAGDGAATIGGVLGMAIVADTMRRVLAPHNGFEQAFGPAWDTQIPESRRSRLPHRWNGYLRPAAPADVHWDVLYATLPGGRQLLCDVWQPPEGVPTSGVAMIYVHGGGWQTMDKDSGTRPFFRRLSAQGHVVMDVSYRLCPETDMRGMLGDVKRAVAWMRGHAADYGADPNRVVLAGASAGGHLALLAAYTPHVAALAPDGETLSNTAVRGVIAWYAPTDLTRYSGDRFPRDWPLFVRVAYRLGMVNSPNHLSWAELERKLLGAPIREAREQVALLSPITYVGPHCPPTLIIYGTHDGLIPIEDPRSFYAALRECRVPAVYLELPWVDHAFDMAAPYVSPAAQAAYQDVEQFLEVMAG
ncbi:MAG: alpha/beta hydrolase fold domain-containing protein [Nitrososphaerales archaeon]